MYYFSEPLIEAIIIKRKSQFSFLVNLNENEIVAHCPTTGRIGDIEMKNIACLLSYSDDPKRKMPYTVEAISCDDLNEKIKDGSELIRFYLIN